MSGSRRILRGLRDFELVEKMSTEGVGKVKKGENGEDWERCSS